MEGAAAADVSDRPRDGDVTQEVEMDLAWKTTLDDDDTFAKLDEADLSYVPSSPSPGTAVSAASGDQHGPADLIVEHHAEQQAQARESRPRVAQRSKRKNFSKQLQLLCLQRYAQHARDFGRLPDKNETNQLLQQSYAQYMKEGGQPDEPRLSQPEFLKLIRNRRREIQARAARPPKPQRKANETSTQRRRRLAALTPAKRKLQEEHARICELIADIDHARKAAGLISDQNQQQRLSLKTSLRSHLNLHQNHPQAHQTSSVDVVEVGPPSLMESLPPLPPDPQEQMETILQLHQETRDVQREIAQRLRSISRTIRQHEGMGEEPSSASV